MRAPKRSKTPRPPKEPRHRLNPFTSELPTEPDIDQREFDREYQTMWEVGRGNAIDSNDLMPPPPDITPA